MTTTKQCVPAILAILLVAAGCNAKEKTSTAGAGGSGSTTATGQSSSTGPDPHYACAETSFMQTQPMKGPGYDETMGGFIGTPQASYVISSTQLYTDPSQDSAFFKAFGPVLTSLNGNPDGLVAFTLGADSNCHVYRTLAIWESQDKMMAWVGGGAHATAASKFSSVSITGKVTFWTATADDVKALTWDVARMHLDQVQPLAY